MSDIKDIKFIIEDHNGKQFRSKGKPTIWLTNEGVPVLSIEKWDSEYLEGEELGEDFKLVGCGYNLFENDE